MAYEYRIIQLAAGATISHINERLSHMVAEGWEPCMFAGDANVNILMRREAPPDQPAQPAQA